MLPPTGMVVDTAADEVFVSDGELQFHRHVIVCNSETGAFKWMWGAYGNRPDDLQDLPPYSPDDSAPQQFRGPHCVEMSHDGLLYVCDRFNDRLQVFQKDGTFVTEKFIARDTLYPGSVYDSAFSADPEQRFLYIADGMNKKVWTLLRESREVVGRFSVGRNNGVQFNHPHSIATNSNGTSTSPKRSNGNECSGACIGVCAPSSYPSNTSSVSPVGGSEWGLGACRTHSGRSREPTRSRCGPLLVLSKQVCELSA